MKKTIIIDTGHGGIDKEGNYTTAPNKMFKFDNGEIAYEGEINRMLARLLRGSLIDMGIKSVFTIPPDNPKDIRLKDRVSFVNSLNPKEHVLLSLHSNASPSHKASGFEVWTSKGQTESDKIAEEVSKSIKNYFPDIKFRSNQEDGDLDKESQFYVLRKTFCPAILIESLFFDNYNDFKLLKDDDFMEALAWAIADGVNSYLESL